MSALLDSLVGQSEGNIRQAAACCLRCLPVVDARRSRKGVRRASLPVARTDSGVSAGCLPVFGWLNIHESDAFVVCTANDVSRSTGAARGSERFDGTFFACSPQGEKKRSWHMYSEASALERRSAAAPRRRLHRPRRPNHAAGWRVLSTSLPSRRGPEYRAGGARPANRSNGCEGWASGCLACRPARASTAAYDAGWQDPKIRQRARRSVEQLTHHVRSSVVASDRRPKTASPHSPIWRHDDHLARPHRDPTDDREHDVTKRAHPRRQRL